MKYVLPRIRLTAVSLAALSSLACDQENAAEDTATTEPQQSPEPEQKSDKLEDAEIREALKKVLNRDPGVHGPSLSVTVTDGVVELTGKASDLLTQRRAVLVAENVKGVRAVSDRIDLELTERPDEELAKNIQDALLYDAATDSYEIDVSVSKGVATLTGKVQSYQERELAERIAEGIKGVRSVHNRIEVDWDSERSDAEIAADVESRLRWDSLVNDGLIKTEVDAGKVTLTGVVASAAERRRAYSNAWVRGVTHVDTSGLNVTWSAKEQDLTKNKRRNLDDREIENAIREAAAYDPRLSAANLRVEVENGTAALNGSVDSPQARLAAEDLARHTAGVSSVTNNLSVVPTKEVPDALIEDRIESGLAWDPYTEAYRIVVTSTDGKVLLTGSVDTAFERAEATQIAGSVSGVKDVDNELVISNSAESYVYSPHYHPYAPYWETWHYVSPTTSFSDRIIQEDIRRELTWSPFVDENQVTVVVKAGKAKLTGKVDTWGERAAATENAFEGGAIVVENDLVVSSNE